jgi:small subunit ribosomal protein S11
MADETPNVETPVSAPETAPAASIAPADAPATPAAPAAAGDQRPSTSGDRAVSQSIWAEIGGGDPNDTGKVVKAKGSKNVQIGLVHVYATFNNTIVTVTDRLGNVLGWSTAGKMGFRGSRKGTAYAAQVVSQDACRQAMGHGLREVEVRLRGPGSGRESAVRAVQALGIDVTTIKDVTPIPHNGCRRPKARRV